MGSDETAELQRRNFELATLNEIAEALNESPDLTQALQVTLAKVASLLELETGWVWLLREEDGRSYLAADLNLPPALTNDPARMEGGCYCLRTYRDGDLEGAANINVVECSRLEALVDGTDGLRYHASVPLYAGHRKLGVFNVASTNWRELSTDDLQLLHTVGDLLSIAIQRTRLFDQSARLGAVEERNRLARELHDTLAQSLSAVALQLESADALLELEARQMEAQAAVRRALLTTRASLDEVRRSVLDLRAAPLENRTLAAALAELAREAKPGTPVDFHLAGDDRTLPPRIEAGVYRIAQEALNNIQGHAQAQSATISLMLSPKSVRLVVEDNGRGFDMEQVDKSRFGLIGISERVRLLNGALSLESEVGQGTRLNVSIPLNSG